MEIEKTKVVKVNAKVLKMHIKVSDRFSYRIEDEQGEEIFSQDDGYVPDFMPGQHYGDYVILDIYIDTGMILNWKKPTSEQIQQAISAED